MIATKVYSYVIIILNSFQTQKYIYGVLGFWGFGVLGLVKAQGLGFRFAPGSGLRV